MPAAPKRRNSFTNLLGMVKDVSTRSSLTKKSNKTKPGPYAMSGAVTELSLVEFECFLTQTLSKQVEADSASLRQLYQSLDLDIFQDTLTEMEMGLLSLLKSHPSLPTPVVAQLHSYLGLIYLETENNNSAVDSFMRAIWFQSRTPEDTFAIAQANHRLGMAYGRKREYKQARDLLDRAIGAYDSSSEIYVTAKEDRHRLQEEEQLALLAKTRPHAIRRSLNDSTTSGSSAGSLSAAEQAAQRRARRRSSRSHQSLSRSRSGSSSAGTLVAELFSSQSERMTTSTTTSKKNATWGTKKNGEDDLEDLAGFKRHSTL